jgi:transcriptional regulator with XRE-family HTH domain
MDRRSEIDRRIARKLTMRMLLLGVTPERLARALRMPRSELHRVLTGRTRLGALGIFEVSLVLMVPVNYFFEELVEP